jgi:hypothetical protein
MNTLWLNSYAYAMWKKFNIVGRIVGCEARPFCRVCSVLCDWRSNALLATATFRAVSQNRKLSQY